MAKNKNVLVIHLESFQQFLIDYKWHGKEVTPNLNKLYHANDTISFDNFFNQVGQGKTSDAEMMLENSLYGLQAGSAMSSYGTSNTFESAPAILSQKAGYTTAVMHGGAGSFWNRNNAYKSFGYQYFMPLSYYVNKPDYYIGYGLKDKLLFSESIKYLEQMQQPFYAKYITVTNHIPFSMDKEDLDPKFKTTNTRDETINNYFQTAHYLDEAVHEFFNYLKASGLYKNTMVVIYGDHYGLSNSENETLAPVIGESSDTWNSYNNVQMQRVPFMIHAANLKGGINSEVAGEIDVLPTLMHLLGISNKNYVQFGSDLLSPQYKDWIVFRNGTIVSKRYIIIGNKGIKGVVYDRITGKQIINFTPEEKREIEKLSIEARQSLKYSDLLNNHNLLRFYTPHGFIPTAPSEFDYLTNFEQMVKLRRQFGTNSSSLYSKRNSSTTNLYKTDAVELKNRREEITQIPKNVQSNQLTDKKEEKKNSNK